MEVKLIFNKFHLIFKNRFKGLQPIHMKQILFLVSSILAFTFATAQKVITVTPEYEWSVASTQNTGSRYGHFSWGFDNYILSTGQAEKIIPVEVGKDKWGVVKINENGKVLWQLNLTDPVVGIGMFNENIIAICVDDKYKTVKVSATIINPATGKQLREKLIYQNPTSNQLEVKVQNKPDGSFNNILIRISDFKVKSGFNFSGSREDQLATNKMQVLYIGADLSIKPIEIRTSISIDAYCGSLLDKSGNIFISGTANNQLYAFKFSADGVEKQKLFTPLVDKSSGPSCLLAFDEANDNRIIIALRHNIDKKTPAIQLVSFDFANLKTNFSQDEELEKEYAKAINLEHVKGTYTGGLKPIDDLEIRGIVQSQNKIAVIKEIRTSSYNDRSSSTTYFNNAWIVSLYDKDLKHLKTFGLDKQFQVFAYAGLSIGYHQKGEHLYIVTPSVSGIASYVTVFSDINLTTERIENSVIIDKGSIGKAKVIESGATLWFDKNFLLNYLVPVGTLQIKAKNTILQKVEY